VDSGVGKHEGEAVHMLIFEAIKQYVRASYAVGFEFSPAVLLKI
jgi:hypothetical protein